MRKAEKFRLLHALSLLALVAMGCSLSLLRTTLTTLVLKLASAATPRNYAGWKQTRMANVVRDPKAHPDAVLGDFTHPDPRRTFDLEQVAFVYGSRWKQRYFTKMWR